MSSSPTPIASEADHVCDSNANDCKASETGTAATMNLAHSFPILGPVGERLIQPCCVNVSPTGRYAVVDKLSCMIVVYSKVGVYSHHFSTLPARMFHFYWSLAEHEPHSVAWLADERLVYSLPQGGAVIVCHGNGQRCGVISGRPLYEPNGIAVNSVDHIFVADRQKGRVLCYDSGGKLLRTIGGFGAVEGELTFPHYVTIGPGDTVYVNNLPAGQPQKWITVQKYSNRGSAHDSITTSVIYDDVMGSLAVDDQGTMYQVDNKGRSVIQICEPEVDSDVGSETASSTNVNECQEEVLDLENLKHVVYATIGRTSELVCIDIEDMMVKVYVQKSHSLENGLSGSHGSYMRDSREILNDDFDTPPDSPK